jgi:hypothetical protein
MSALINEMHEATKLPRERAIVIANLIQQDDVDWSYEPLGLADTNDAVIEVFDRNGELLGYL